MNSHKLLTLIITSFLIGCLVIKNDLAAADIMTTTGKKIDSELSKLAHAMKPGEWAELKDKRPHKLMRVFVGHRESGKEVWHHIAGWTDDGKWDPKTRQFLFMGFRKQNKFIAYSEDSNQWRVLPGPFGWNTSAPGTFKDTRKTGFGHVYGRNALDADHGIFYVSLADYTYAYNLQDGTWSRTPGGSDMSIEYFPGLGLLSHETRPNKSKTGFPLNLINPDTSTWEPFATLPFSGYHAIVHYNPKMDEMLFIAGNKNRSVISLKRNGQLTRKKDLPFDMTIRYGQVVVDPNTGLYLIFSQGSLTEFNSKTNQYRSVRDYRPPWGKYEMPVPAAIPELGVILFVDDKTLLYKHHTSHDP
ncbi:hypothetical protein A8C75_08230 [Marinobacterium aestuarii]|uniref:Uncharacterized protein n=1 Tax=Marinobacterium aestuarii TaxID=1821621 RepID=A0A1A9EXU3_9GAMM|nr:hypothetical protein [Marinobacterium aestuarii]ANG62478.1 hypothetical protein A8C75_08230 [Marinobacterium aestuarii]